MDEDLEGPAGTPPSRPPVRLRGWRPLAWVLMLGAALLTVLVEFVALVYIGLTYSSTCYDPPDPQNVHEGQQALLRLAGVVVLPWGVAAATVRPHTRVVVTGLMCTSPATIEWVRGFSTASWVGGFCF